MRTYRHDCIFLAAPALLAFLSVGCGAVSNNNSSISVGPPGPVLTDVSPRTIRLSPNVTPYCLDTVPVRLASVSIGGRDLRQTVLYDTDPSRHLFYVRFADTPGPWANFFLTRDYTHLIGDLYIPVPLLYNEPGKARRLIVIDSATGRQLSTDSDYSLIVSVILQQ